jgi:hypothetical protein
MRLLAEVPVADDAEARPDPDLLDQFARRGRPRAVGGPAHITVHGRSQQLDNPRHAAILHIEARAAATMSFTPIPAWSISSVGVPEVGSPRTARCFTRTGSARSASDSSTADPRPPCG